MGTASIIRNVNVYVDGGSYLGEIKEFEEPKIAMSTEDIRTGGMLGPVAHDTGVEKLEATLNFARNQSALARKFGTAALDGVRLRLVAAHQDGDGQHQAVEVYLAGKFTELDFGKGGAGEKVEQKFKAALVSYRRVVNGFTDIKIHMQDGIFITGGIDRNAEVRAIITS